MNYKIGVLMEPLTSINKELNSSYALIMEGLRRGHEIYQIDFASISYNPPVITSDVFHILNASPQGYDHIEYKKFDLNFFDIILFRMDPPINMNYITITYLLEKLTHPYVTASPFTLRNLPEKILTNGLEQFLPPFIITNQLKEVLAFIARYKEIVLKPLYSYQGKGIMLIKENDPNLDTIFSTMYEKYCSPILVQQFIPDVKNGCNRIIIIDGEIMGSLNIKPGFNSFKVFTGGEEMLAAVTGKQKEICAITADILKAHNILIAGLDFIGDYLLEVNITSPGCISRFKNKCGIDIARLYFNTLESKMKKEVIAIN